MRALFSALFGLVAAAALTLALPLSWVATHVASEDGYVGFTAELADDAQLRDDLAAAVTDEIVTVSGISPQFAPVVERALSSASDQVVDQPAFDTAWRETQRRSHQATFGDPADLSAEQDAATRLVVDLGPVAQVVADSVTEDLPISIEAPEQVLVPVSGSDQRSLIEQVNQTPDRAVLAAGVAAVAAGLSWLCARRRGGALAWLGLLAVGVAGLVHLLADRGIPRLIERNTASTDLAQRVQSLLAERAVDSLDGWLVITAIAGGAAVVVGLISRAIGSRREHGYD